jgi:hypothetical protein
VSESIPRLIIKNAATGERAVVSNVPYSADNAGGTVRVDGDAVALTPDAFAEMKAKHSGVTLTKRRVALHNPGGPAKSAVVEMPDGYPNPPLVTFDGKSYVADAHTPNRYWEATAVAAQPVPTGDLFEAGR